MRVFGVLLILTLVVACGRSDRSARVPVALAAQGPINAACLSAGRQAANRALCGCIQAVADQTLTRSDQALGARFFADPAFGQEIKVSDTPPNEAFWERWSTFADQSREMCRDA